MGQEANASIDPSKYNSKSKDAVVVFPATTLQAANGKKVTVTNALTTDLPPMLFVGLNYAATDVPEGANWEESDGAQAYKFSHRASDQPDLINADPGNGKKIVHDLRKPEFLRSLLDWVWRRLDLGNDASSSEGPSFGAIKAAWDWQWPIIHAWQADPMGPEEQWAQCFSEVFDGLAYNGHANAYRFNLTEENAWDTYVFSRIQDKFLQHGKNTRTGRGRAIVKWDDIKTIPQMTDEQWSKREWIQNDDPAAPITSTCNFIITYVVVTRGFRIENEAKEHGEIGCSAGFTTGLSAGPIGDDAPDGTGRVPAFSWRWFANRGEEPTIADCVKKYGTPIPGSVCTYHPYHKVLSKNLSLPGIKVEPKAVDESDADAVKKAKLEADQKTQSAFTTAMYEIAKNTEGQEGKLEEARKNWMAAHGKSEGDPGVVSGSITGQPYGSHINVVFRLHQKKDRVQIYQPGSGRHSSVAISAEGPIKRAAYPFNDECMSEGAAEQTLGSAVRPYSNGVGIAVPAPHLPEQITALKKARPIGLVRLVLTTRKEVAKIGANDILFVSRIQQMYGRQTHQNFTIARLLWSLRNTPGFTDVQPWWVVYLPWGDLAKAMWAYGSREMKLTDFVAKYRSGTPGGLVFGVDYVDSQLLTGNADPCGTVSRCAEVSSAPPMGDPNAGGTSINDSACPFPAFMRKTRLPLPPLPDGRPDTRGVLLPFLWTNDANQKGRLNDAFPWNATYIREDIAKDGAVPPPFAEDW